MDPNANILEQETLLTERFLTDHLTSDDSDRLHELRIALVEWLGKGGFEPDWSKAPLASQYYGR